MREELAQRFFKFAVDVIGLSRRVSVDRLAVDVLRQLMRSSTSIGANWEEAVAGLSKSDFTHSANIARKEARESHYWLRIMAECFPVSRKEGIDRLIKECDEIVSILTTVVKKQQTGVAKKVITVLLFSSLILHPSSLIYAARIYPSAGTTSATFLKIGVGARAEGMAGAFTAVADDPSAVYWNPAGLAYIKERALGFSHNDRFQGLNQEFLSCVLPGGTIGPLKNSVFSSGVWGLGINYFHTQKDLERRSGAEETLNVFTAPEGSFRAYDLAFSLSYGWRPRPGTGLGATLKAIRQTIDDRSGASFALDLGALRDFKWLGRNFTSGLAVQNIGPGVKFTSTRYDLPLNFKAGLSHRLPGSGLLLSMDADKPVDNYPFFILGMEYPLANRLAMRTGYKYRLYGNETGGFSGFAAGFGLAFGRFSFDYAFTPFGELGNNHILSLALKFWEPSGNAPGVPRRAAAPARRLPNEKTFAYESARRALTISPQGVLYEIKAVSKEGSIPSVRFKTMSRGPAAAELSISEGDPSEEISAEFPQGFAPVKVLQLAGVSGEVQGGITFEFRASSGAVSKETAAFFYQDGTVWKQASPEFTGEEAGSLRFNVSVPSAPRYAISVKKP